MSEPIVCPTCGATGRQECSRIGGRDHKSRLLLRFKVSKPTPPAGVVGQEGEQR